MLSSQQTQNICITFIQCWTSKTLGRRCIDVTTYFCVRWVVPQWVWLEIHKRDVWCDVSPATLQSSWPTRRCVRENYFWAERWKTFQNVAQNLPIHLPDCVYIQSPHHHSTVHIPASQRSQGILQRSLSARPPSIVQEKGEWTPMNAGRAQQERYMDSMRTLEKRSWGGGRSLGFHRPSCTSWRSPPDPHQLLTTVHHLEHSQNAHGALPQEVVERTKNVAHCWHVKNSPRPSAFSDDPRWPPTTYNGHLTPLLQRSSVFCHLFINMNVGRTFSRP